MKPTGLILAALAIAVTCTPARAQTVTVPRTYPIPMPPMSQPNIEVGLRYWQSEGKTRFGFNSSLDNPLLGDPTSVLTYDGMDAFAGEFFWFARNETDTFAKGFIGGGGLNNGSLDDEDYFAGQVKFSDTFSRIKGSDLIYGTIDVGQRFTLADGATKVTIGPFAGFNFWQETAEAFGARCNPDDIDGALCGPPGSVAIPFSTMVIENEANWASLRLGAELKVRLWDRLTLSGDAAVLPVAFVWNEDSHLLRGDLGPVPNIESRGTGWGYQLEGALQFDLTPCWALGAGVRYWHAEVDGKTDFIHLDSKVPLREFESERLGVFGEVAYRFATF